jgi:hypothetical protein
MDDYAIAYASAALDDYVGADDTFGSYGGSGQNVSER